MYHNLLYQEAVKKTESKDNIKVIEGIKSLRDSGKPEAVNIIVNLLNKNQTRDVQNECIKFLNDIKDQKATEFIVRAIQDQSNKKILNHLVSCAWQNNLDYSEFLDVFIDLALKEEYLIAYESFTVIETNIDKLEADKVNRIEKKISDEVPRIEKEKQPMIKELVQVIHELKKS